MDWYTQLPPDQQAALQGLVVMAVFALIKAICHWSGRPLSDTAAAKVTKLLAVAAATAATTIVVTGTTPQFWMQWAVAMVFAVGPWEILSKTYAVAPSVPLDPEEG